MVVRLPFDDRDEQDLLRSGEEHAATRSAAGIPAPAGGEAALGFERTRASGPPELYLDRKGYDPCFLGRGDALGVAVPDLPSELAEQAAVVDRRAAGLERFVLPYTHFSVVMNGRRRLPFFSAANINGNELRSIPRTGDAWAYDPRIDRNLQAGDDVYANTPFDRGHMTRRLDPVWGTPGAAALADEDTFHFTNACPQHKDLNRKEWAHLEDYVLGNAGTEDLKGCGFTGPVLAGDDTPFRGLLLPKEYWKVVVMVRKDTHRLSATGYLLSQKDMLTGFEAFAFGQFKTYQVTLREIEQLTGLDFGGVKNSDPMSRARPAGGFESVTGLGAARMIGGPADLVL